MNDIERLGEIKEQFEYGIKHQFEDYNVALSDIDWLIEQAERVQELEEENFALMESLRFQDEILERQNKRYREALKNAKYAIHTQITSINHQENTESEKWYIRGMTFSMDMINKYFDEALEGEAK